MLPNRFRHYRLLALDARWVAGITVAVVGQGLSVAIARSIATRQSRAGGRVHSFFDPPPDEELAAREGAQTVRLLPAN